MASRPWLIWATSQAGLRRIRPSPRVFEDREGNLWTGGASGLERLRDSAFVSYSAPEGLPTDGSNPGVRGCRKTECGSLL